MAGTRSAASPGSVSSNRTKGLSEPRRPATRSLSRITEDDSHDDDEEETDITPSQTAKDRRTSFASTSRQTRRSKSRTAMSTTARNPDQHTPLVKQLKLRPSLAGPQVHEMDIDTRAQVLIPIAEDCIIQLLRAGLNGSFYRGSANESWQLAWESLQSQRRNKLFSPDSLPFNDFEDVRESFHSSVRRRINTASLERAIHLSNLATFLWVMLQPDKAHTLLGSPEGRTPASRRSRIPLGTARVEDEERQDVRDIVSRRNRVFGMAWKRYWKDVIPQSMRANKHSINLWAHLSVQIMMTFQMKTIDGEDDTDSNVDLPLPDPEFSTELFSASAIARYGQWTVGMASEHDLATKETAQRRWTEVAKHRQTELRELREEVLKERFTFDAFRRDILHFVDEAVLHTLLSSSASPRKPDLDDIASSTSASGQEEGPVESNVTGAVLEADVEDETDVANESLIGGSPTELAERGTVTPSVEPEEVDNALDLNLDLDLLSQVLKGMTPDDLAREDETHDDNDDFPSEINSEEPEQHDAVQQTQNPMQSDREDDDIPSDIHSGQDDPDQDTDWAVKNASVPRIRTRKTEQNFHFAARQASAEQVAWESQSQSRTPKRKAKTPLFLPHNNSDSDDSASATPRAGKRAAREINDSILRSGSGQQDLSRRTDAEDLDSMMPGLSILGTPVRASRRQARPADLAPSPMPRGHSPKAIASGESTESEDGRPSNSLSPQRPNDHDHEVAVATPIVADRPIPSSSRKSAMSSARPTAVSQRVLSGSRKRRRTDPEGDFATASSTGEESGHEIAPSPQRRVVRTPTPPRQTARRTLGPLRKELRNTQESPPRPSNYVRDLIIVPPIRPATDYASEDGYGSENAYHNDDTYEGPAARKAPIRTPTRSPQPVDFFLFDEDGSPLEPDPAYRIPPYHRPLPSMLHGRKDNQTSQYTRMSGKRKWTMDEQVLLYRTIQKVPLDEPSPLQVVWYLHGEYGTLSNNLEDFNVQHMKDKMKTVVQVRYNNHRSIEGRARFWLPPVPAPDGKGIITHPDKVELAAEIERAVKVRTRRDRAANKEDAERLQREEDAAKAEKAEQAKKAREAKKKAKKGKKGTKGKKRASRRFKTDDELESEEAEEDEEENSVEVDPNTPEEDESYDPKRSTRSKRAIRQPTRGSGPKRDGDSREGYMWATSADPQVPEGVMDESNDGAAGNMTPNDSDVRQRPRHRLVPVIELTTSRSNSKPKSRTTRAPANVLPTDPSDQHEQSQGSIPEELPQHDLSESEAETEYDAPPSNGKMMRRSIVQAELAPGHNIPSASESEDKEDELGDTSADEQEVSSEESPDNESIDTQATLAVAAPASPTESEDDETDRLEQVARRLEIEQRVLRGVGN